MRDQNPSTPDLTGPVRSPVGPSGPPDLGPLRLNLPDPSKTGEAPARPSDEGQPRAPKDDEPKDGKKDAEGSSCPWLPGMVCLWVRLDKLVGSRNTALLLQILGRLAAGIEVSFESAFPITSMKDRNAQEKAVFSTAAARSAFRKLRTDAMTGRYGMQAAQLLACFDHDKVRVRVRPEALRAALGHILGVSSADGAALASVPGGSSGRETPPRPPAKKAGKTGTGRKPAFPDLRLYLIRDERGFGLRDRSDGPATIETVANKLLPNEAGYCSVMDADGRTSVARVLINEWLQVGAPKVWPSGHDDEDAKAKRMGFLFCNWVRKRSALTLDGREQGRLWWRIDVFRAAVGIACEKVLGKAHYPPVILSRLTAEVFWNCRVDMLGGVGGSVMEDTASNPDMMFRAVRRYIEGGCCLLDRLGMDIDNVERRINILVAGFGFSSEFGGADNSPYPHVRQAAGALVRKWSFLCRPDDSLDPDLVNDVEGYNPARWDAHDERLVQNLADARRCLARIAKR